MKTSKSNSAKKVSKKSVAKVATVIETPAVAPVIVPATKIELPKRKFVTLSHSFHEAKLQAFINSQKNLFGNKEKNLADKLTARGISVSNIKSITFFRKNTLDSLGALINERNTYQVNLIKEMKNPKGVLSSVLICNIEQSYKRTDLPAKVKFVAPIVETKKVETKTVKNQKVKKSA